jgi:RNA recognition motif-containing protein
MEIESIERSNSSVFKLKVDNLGKFVSKKDVLKLLLKLELDHKNVKVAPKWSYAIVGFENEQDLEKAQTLLEGYEYGGKTVATQVVKERILKYFFIN